MEIQISKQYNKFLTQNLRTKAYNIKVHYVIFNNIIVNKQLCVDMHSMWSTKQSGENVKSEPSSNWI